MLSLSLRACGRWSWELRGLETHTEIKRGLKWAAVIEIVTTLFNWINNPCWKAENVTWGVWSQSGECQAQNTRLTCTKRQTSRSLTRSNERNQRRKTHSVTNVQTATKQMPRYGQWTYLLSFRFQKEPSQGKSVSWPHRKQHVPQGIHVWDSMERMMYGSWKTQQRLSSATKSPCYVYVTWHVRNVNQWKACIPAYLQVQNQHTWAKCL